MTSFLRASAFQRHALERPPCATRMILPHSLAMAWRCAVEVQDFALSACTAARAPPHLSLQKKQGNKGTMPLVHLGRSSPCCVSVQALDRLIDLTHHHSTKNRVNTIKQSTSIDFALEAALCLPRACAKAENQATFPPRASQQPIARTVAAKQQRWSLMHEQAVVQVSAPGFGVQPDSSRRDASAFEPRQPGMRPCAGVACAGVRPRQRASRANRSACEGLSRCLLPMCFCPPCWRASADNDTKTHAAAASAQR